MKYILKNLCIPVLIEQSIKSRICSKLNIAESQLLHFSILRKALDTRRKNSPLFVYTMLVELGIDKIQHPDLAIYTITEPEFIPMIKLSEQHPVIIGLGPSGLFSALAMVENGLKPIIYERGDCLEKRAEAVDIAWQRGILDPESNVQFGEGGAGAFSDGKLTSRAGKDSTQRVFDLLVKFGAHESINYEALPHLGTDVIRAIVLNIRNYLINKGCTIHYRSKLESVTIRNNKIESISVNGSIIKPEVLILAIGNAARDTYLSLHNSRVMMEAKPFAIGFRISHPQSWINQAIYGNDALAEKLGAASYRLTARDASRGIYSFCMCPGGYIINASSEQGGTVTNGMSYASRTNKLGNSAVVTQVNAADYGSGLWDGMNLQNRIEQKAFFDRFAAPAQTAKDYLSGSVSKIEKYDCLFAEIKSTHLRDLFPGQINSALAAGLKHFDQILPGFINQGMLIAPETRTSSPIRILREKERDNCPGIENLYAIGEGSGYAGGIISSAADGYNMGRKFHF